MVADSIHCDHITSQHVTNTIHYTHKDRRRILCSIFIIICLSVVAFISIPSTHAAVATCGGASPLKIDNLISNYASGGPSTYNLTDLLPVSPSNSLYIYSSPSFAAQRASDGAIFTSSSISMVISSPIEMNGFALMGGELVLSGSNVEILMRKDCSPQCDITHSCVHGNCTGYNVCTCEHNWVGMRCDQLSACASPNGCVNGYCDSNNQCICKNGFSGARCEIQNDNCSPNPCMNNGRCFNGIASYTCVCPIYFTGVNCSTDTRLQSRSNDPNNNNIEYECSLKPCKNGGLCTSGGVLGGYQCICPPDYFLDDCSAHRLAVVSVSPGTVRRGDIVFLSGIRMNDDMILYIQGYNTSYNFNYPKPALNATRTISFIVPNVTTNADNYVNITLVNPWNEYGFYMETTTNMSSLYFNPTPCVDGQWYNIYTSSCSGCPNGAICPGGSRIWPKTGYWSANETTPPIQCPIIQACPGAVGQRLGYNKAVGSSGATVTDICAEGYTGFACSSCSTNFYQQQGLCFPCSDLDADERAVVALLFVVAAGLIVVIALSVMFLNSVNLAVFVTVVIVLQQFVEVGQMASKSFPPQLNALSAFFSLVSVINFEVEMVKPGCVIGQLGYIEVFWATVTVIGMAGALFCMAALARAYLYVRGYACNCRSLRTAVKRLASINSVSEIEDTSPVKKVVTFDERTTNNTDRPTPVINNLTPNLDSPVKQADIPVADFISPQQAAALESAHALAAMPSPRSPLPPPPPPPMAPPPEGDGEEDGIWILGGGGGGNLGIRRELPIGAIEPEAGIVLENDEEQVWVLGATGGATNDMTPAERERRNREALAKLDAQLAAERERDRNMILPNAIQNDDTDVFTGISPGNTDGTNSVSVSSTSLSSTSGKKSVKKNGRKKSIKKKYVDLFNDIDAQLYKDLPWTVVFRRRCVHALMILSMIAHLKFTSRALEGTYCYSYLGSLVLQSEPGTICYEGSHLITVVFIYLFLVFYSFMMPVYIYVLLKRMMKKDRKSKHQDDTELIDTYGYIYVGLKDKYFWFRLNVFVTNWGLALLNAYALSTDAQLVVASIIFFLRTVLTIGFWPFETTFDNLTQIASGVGGGAYIVVLYGIRLISVDSTSREVPSIPIYIAVCTILGVSLLYSMYTGLGACARDRKRKVQQLLWKRALNEQELLEKEAERIDKEKNFKENMQENQENIPPPARIPQIQDDDRKHDNDDNSSPRTSAAIAPMNSADQHYHAPLPSAPSLSSSEILSPSPRAYTLPRIPSLRELPECPPLPNLPPATNDDVYM